MNAVLFAAGAICVSAMVSAARIVELIRTNDPVLLSWGGALLAEAEVEPVIFNAYASLV